MRTRSRDLIKFTNLLISCHRYLDTDQVSSLSDEYNRTGHFIWAKPERTFYEILVCIVLIIGSGFDIMKNLLLHVKVHTLNYFLMKKTLCKAKCLCRKKQLEKCQKS